MANDLISREAALEAAKAGLKNFVGIQWTQENCHFVPKVVHGVRDALQNVPAIDALPLLCHIGDTVWIVGTKCMSGLYESECRSSECIDVCDFCPLDQEYIVFPREVHGSTFLYIHELEDNPLFRWGETVFKTQEEAEAALEKMKEANHAGIDHA